MINEIAMGIKWKYLLICGLAIALANLGFSQQKVSSPKPYGVLPSQNQLSWQENNIYAFIHFGINTFTDKEWGYGDESPKLFNPTNFNADQIVKSIAQGGFKGIILTCKHHDGFCLWPTKTTAHNISKSPFRGGKGDLVKEIMEACRKYGLKFGVYLSPWDRNAASYGSKDYVNLYKEQLTELLTNYGDIFEIWHDGANGGDGYYGGARETRQIDRTTYYNWPAIWELERRLQPKALIFGDIGEDLRWVGNEKGFAGVPCWQTYTPESIQPGKVPSNGTIKSELATNGTRNGKYWMPAEVDFSIRPGWFWHASENNQVRSALNLWKHYFLSAGRGASMLLNVPPDNEGEIYPTDSVALKQFGEILRETFKENLAVGATARSADVRGGDLKNYGPNNLLDANQFSYWSTNDKVHTGEVIVDLKEEKRFDIIQLKENTKLGQRIDSLEVDAWLDGKWQLIASVNSIGSSRLILLPSKIHTSKVRIRVVSAPVCPALSEFGLYNQAALVDELTQKELHKTYNKEGQLKRSHCSIISPKIEKGNIMDGDPKSTWHNESNLTTAVVILGSDQPRTTLGISYLPVSNAKGAIDKYRLLISLDGKNWKQVAEGEFANIKANPVLQTIHFNSPQLIKFIKFEALHTVDGRPASIAELNVLE